MVGTKGYYFDISIGQQTKVEVVNVIEDRMFPEVQFKFLEGPKHESVQTEVLFLFQSLFVANCDHPICECGAVKLNHPGHSTWCKAYV